VSAALRALDRAISIVRANRRRDHFAGSGAGACPCEVLEAGRHETLRRDFAFPG